MLTSSLGYDAGLVSHHCILRCSPYFGGYTKKCVDALIWRVVMIKWLNIGKPENKLLHKGHYGIKYTSHS